MREEKFGLQARRFDAFFSEKFSAFPDGFEDGHGTNVGFAAALQSLKSGTFPAAMNKKTGLISQGMTEQSGEFSN